LMATWDTDFYGFSGFTRIETVSVR